MPIQNIIAMERRIYGQKQNKIFVKKTIYTQTGVFDW
ncbi:MAG: hypothetical protein RIR11_2789 [Bacteroidota bacterium]|jgi:hypothetical protein